MDPRNALYNQAKRQISAAAWDLCRSYPNLDYGDAVGECNLQWAKSLGRFDPAQASINTFTHYQLLAAKKSVHEKAHTKMASATVRDAPSEPDNGTWSLADISQDATFGDPSRNLADGLDSDECEVLQALFHGTYDNMGATGADVHRVFSQKGWTRRRAYSVLDSMRTKVTDNLVGV